MDYEQKGDIMKRYINIYPSLEEETQFEATADIKFVGYAEYKTKEDADKHAGDERIGLLVIDDSEN